MSVQVSSVSLAAVIAFAGVEGMHDAHVPGSARRACTPWRNPLCSLFQKLFPTTAGKFDHLSRHPQNSRPVLPVPFPTLGSYRLLLYQFSKPSIRYRDCSLRA